MIGPTHPADQLAEAQAIMDAQASEGDGPDATRGEDDNPIEHKGEVVPDELGDDFEPEAA